jgi:flagellar hook-basal body complex protein FliE
MQQMFITPMSQVGSIGDLGTVKKTTGDQSGKSMFQNVFREAVESVKTTDQDLTEKQYLLATGQVDDPHTVTAAAAKAQLSVELLTALRSKALESYNEIIRLSI